MDAKAATRRWYHPTPAWLVYGAVVVTGVLFACERWRWFPVHYQKGFPVLLAVAVVAAVLILILAWMLVALVFRRRVQFGVAMLLVFVTLCAVVCSWLAVRIKQARRQAEVVAVIRENLHGVLIYDWRLNNDGDWLPGVIEPAPEPLRKLLGGDFFADVESLWLVNDEPTDADLSSLVALTALKWLRLRGEKVSDASLSHLEGSANLRELRLLNTNVTDEGVNKLHRALPDCKIYVNEVLRYE